MEVPVDTESIAQANDTKRIRTIDDLSPTEETQLIARLLWAMVEDGQLEVDEAIRLEDYINSGQ